MCDLTALELLVEEQHETILELEACVLALDGLLRSVEYIGSGNGYICPWCGYLKEGGHSPLCKRQLALDISDTVLDKRKVANRP